VGTFLAPVAKALLVAIGPDIVNAVNDLLGTADDHVGTQSVIISAKEMVTLARAPRKNFRGIQWHVESPLISGDGGDYKAYFEIREVD
jgi:hypothetical protein